MSSAEAGTVLAMPMDKAIIAVGIGGNFTNSLQWMNLFVN
jgi:hypothetical protein